MLEPVRGWKLEGKEKFLREQFQRKKQFQRRRNNTFAKNAFRAQIVRKTTSDASSFCEGFLFNRRVSPLKLCKMQNAVASFERIFSDV
jgi:hypothetical protein